MTRGDLVARVALGSVAAAATALLVCGQFLRPPVLLEARGTEADKVREDLPAGAQRVEVALDTRTTLRGWYVPADDGAPIVLHLLEATASVDSRTSTRTLVARQLADLGFASLFVDYGGIGASGGTRSAANLGRDARTMWDEALRRVGGDPQRVVLRCTSLGTLAALPLLQGGARPAGVLLLLPALSDTLAERFAHSFYGRAAGWLARAAFRDVVDESLLGVVRGTPTHWLAVQAERDQLTSSAEREAIEAAVAAAGGRTARLNEDHLIATLQLRGLCDAEVDFLTEVVPGVRDVDARWRRFSEALDPELRDPALSEPGPEAALRALSAWSHVGEARTLLALAGARGDERSTLQLRWWLEEWRYRKLDLEHLRCVADLSDPAGPIPLDVLFAASRIESLSTRTFALRPILAPDEIERLARETVAGDGEPSVRIWASLAGVSSGVELHPGKLLARLIEHGLSDIDARRQLARALLKAYAKPDRCSIAENGSMRLEYWSQGAWHALESDPARPSMLNPRDSDASVRIDLGLPISD